MEVRQRCGRLLNGSDQSPDERRRRRMHVSFLAMAFVSHRRLQLASITTSSRPPAPAAPGPVGARAGPHHPNHLDTDVKKAGDCTGDRLAILMYSTQRCNQRRLD
jgi:hypothetical protein